MNNIGKLDISGIAKVVDKASKINGVIHLETGDVDFDPPKEILKHFKDGFEKHQCHYPPLMGNDDLLEKINEIEHINNDKEKAIVTAGGSIGIFLTLFSILNPGDNIVIFEPCWPHFKEMIKICRANAIIINLSSDNFHLKQQSLNNLSNIRAILLCSPNNPTGTIFTNVELEIICKFASKNDSWIIFDAEYDLFCYNGIVNNYPRRIYDKVIISKSISKTYASAGLRLGYLFGNKKLIDRIKNLSLYTTMYPNSLVQYSLYNLLQENSAFSCNLKAIMENRVERCVKILNELDNVRVKKPDGGLYLWLDCTNITKKDIEIADEILYNYKVAVVPGSCFGENANGFLRISLGCNDDLLFEAIKKIKLYFKEKC